MAKRPSESFSPSTGASAEYLAFVQNFDVLVSTVKVQPAGYADLLFARGYIPTEVLEYTRLNGVLDSDKARKLVDIMMEQIKMDPTAFEGFIEVLKATPAEFTIKKLQSSYEQHKNKTRSLQHMQASPSPTLDAHTDSKPPYSATLDPGFECSFCGECSMEQYFSDSGCSKLLAQTDAFTFPYLRKEHLEKSQIIELEGRLRYETKSMMVRFAEFTRFVKKSLEKQQVPLEEVKDVILSLGAFEEDIGVKVLDSEDRQKIKAAKSLTEIFITLRDYISFFNYEIIQHLIKDLGSTEVCCELVEYFAAFDKFCQRNVFEVPPDAFCSNKRCRRTARKFVLKCTERLATLKSVQGVKERIAVVLGLRTTALQLCSVKQGCVELHFLISTVVADRIFPMSPATESALSEIGVRVLHHQEQRTDSESDIENLKYEKSGERRAPIRQTDVQSGVYTHESFPTALNVGSTALEGASVVEEMDTQPTKSGDHVIQERESSTSASGAAKLSFPSGELKWRRGKDMPIKMGGHVQSVVIEDALFVGGGWAGDNPDECKVMKLDLQQDRWTTLPQYTFRYFAMTSLHSKLLLVVGGCNQRTYEPTNQIAVFQSGKWTHPYPSMNNSRRSSTAVSFNDYIIVAGGYGVQGRISSVEVLDVTTRKWYTTQSLPEPQSEMKSALIGNTMYLIGGCDHTGCSTKKMLHVDPNELIANYNQNISMATLWQMIHNMPLKRSTPISIGRSLLAVGGRVDFHESSSSIHLYQPDPRKWVKVGDLPTARFNCTCSVLPSGQVIVAGGNTSFWSPLNTVDLCSNFVQSLIMFC